MALLTTYETTIDWIHSLLPHGMKPGLARVEWMLGELGHPERRVRSIHIGGTNGKGSTVSFLRHMLQEGGCRIGTFTSPYIVRFNERISVNGKEISDRDLIDVANRVKPLVDRLSHSELGSPSEFEVITVMAMVYFADIASPDFVIFEVGLGGRFDSTNVIHPLLTVITNVGTDHTEILGNDVGQIAGEKAGIIKSGTPVITAVTHREALPVIRTTSANKKAKLYRVDETFTYVHDDSKENGTYFSYRSPFSERRNLFISMKGYHQVQNAALALMAVDYLKQYYALVIEEIEIREGLKKANWPGRFEEISRSPHIILDGAHNPEGVQSLVDTLEEYYPNKRVHVLFAALEHKKIKDMLQPLRNIAAQMTFTTFNFKTAATGKALAACADFPANVEEDWRNVLAAAKQHDENTVLVVTGSLYFISQVRNFFLAHNK